MREVFGRIDTRAALPTEFGADAGLMSLWSASVLALVPESLRGRLHRRGEPGATATTPPTKASGAARLVAQLETNWCMSPSGPRRVGSGFAGFYRDVIAALADVPVRVLLTIGDAGDPDELGILPATSTRSGGGARRR